MTLCECRCGCDNERTEPVLCDTCTLLVQLANPDHGPRAEVVNYHVPTIDEMYSRHLSALNAAYLVAKLGL